MACVYVYVIILAFIGPEYKGRRMDASSDHDLAEARGVRGSQEYEHSGSDEEKNEKV